MDAFRLDGKTALVTGCRRGIGRAIALGLAEAGAHILGVSQQMPPDGGDTGELVRKAGVRFQGFRADLARRDHVHAILSEIEASQVEVDILVNNAGVTHRAPSIEYPDDAWDRVLAVNLSTPFLLAREVARPMLKRRRGKIIFLGSLLTFQGGIEVPAYAASKGAIAQLVMALSNEWASQGVQVNAIAPGYIATDLTAPLEQDAQRGPAITDRIPAGRWGEPDDLRGAAVFLASAASDYVTGTTLVVDGGWMGR